MGTEVPLAILPGGTGSVVAQQLGIAGDLESALRQLFGQEREVRSIDVLELGGRLSLLRVGMGADAGVMRRATRAGKDRMGWMAYLLAALEEARECEPRPLELDLDGRPTEAVPA